MGRRIMVILGLAFPLGIAQASAAPATKRQIPNMVKSWQQTFARIVI